MAKGQNAALFGSIITDIGKAAGLFNEPPPAPVTPTAPAPAAMHFQTWMIVGAVGIVVLLLMTRKG